MPAHPLSIHKAADDLQLDSRRAAWLPEARVLALADVHFGYALARRQRGALLPLDSLDDTSAAILALQREYKPAEVVFLGDLVDRPLDLPEFLDPLKVLMERLAAHSTVVWTPGNHDRDLARRLAEQGVPLHVTPWRDAGRFRLVHGDTPPDPEEPRLPRDGCLVMGHEHPAIVVADGMSALKCPCFLVSAKAVVLPAVSRWAAGSVAGRQEWMSPRLRGVQFQQAVAVMGEKLLPLPL